MPQITTTDAAVILGVTDTRVRALWKAGHLIGRKFGKVLLLESASVYARRRKADKGKLSKGGRPKHPTDQQ